MRVNSLALHDFVRFFVEQSSAGHDRTTLLVQGGCIHGYLPQRNGELSWYWYHQSMPVLVDGDAIAGPVVVSARTLYDCIPTFGEVSVAFERGEGDSGVVTIERDRYKATVPALWAKQLPDNGSEVWCAVIRDAMAADPVAWCLLAHRGRQVTVEILESGNLAVRCPLCEGIVPLEKVRCSGELVKPVRFTVPKRFKSGWSYLYIRQYGNGYTSVETGYGEYVIKEDVR